MAFEVKSEKNVPLTTDNDSDEQKLSRTSKAENFIIFSNKSWKVILLTCIPIALICLLVWLDEDILVTAISRISDEFNSFNEIEWYGPFYLFGLCACQLSFKRTYKDFSFKITYLICLLIFEITFIVQITAPSSITFIIERVLTGINGSDVLAGSLIIFLEEISKAKLFYVMSAFNWIHSISGIAGSVIEGVITSSSLTWRWY